MTITSPDRARRILVTGSTEGIGAGIAQALQTAGHVVVRHARNEQRAGDLRRSTPGVGEIVLGDLGSLAGTAQLAREITGAGPFDVVVHNAGWSPPGPDRPVGVDGIETTFQINALSLYVLLASTPLPPRTVLVSSDSIRRAHLNPDDPQHEQGWTTGAAYADSKLAGTALAFALARRRPDLLVTAAHPGWVRTKMSAGSAAPLSIEEGADTPAWLAVSDDPAATVSGGFYLDRHQERLNEQCWDENLQERLISACRALTGLDFPG